DNQCHGVSNPRLWKQWEACYSFTTDPDLTPLGGIRAPATVGKCTELSTEDPLYDKQLGYKSHDGTSLVALPNVSLPVDFGLDCDGFFGTGVITQASNPLLRFAQAGWRSFGSQVSRVFGVKPAYAIDLGLGDRVRVGDGFSNINWGIGLDGSIAGGGEQSVPVGTSAAPLELLIEYSHIHTHSTDGDEEYEEHVERIGGVPVVFTVSTGNGFFGLDATGAPMRTTTVMTSIGELDLGIAAVNFTADPNAVANVVTATAPTLDGLPFLFNITGQPSDLISADLVRSVDVPTTSDALSWSFAIRNTGAGTALPSTARLTVSLDGSADGPVATRDVTVPSLAAGAAHVIEAVEAIGPLAAGTYIVTVTADHPALVVEGDCCEANNSATETFTVADPPDLTVASFTRSPAFPTTADAVTYTIQISNIGGSTAPASSAQITTGWSRQTETGDMEAGGSVDFLEIGEIPAGDHLIIELPQGTLTAATHSASIVVDIANGIAESNETNNSLSLPSFVVGAATLVTMSGQVTDLAGAALPGATVSIIGTPYAAVTNVSGLYQIANVPAGTYTVSASFIGYQTSSRSVTVAPGMPAASFQLTLMPPIDPGGDGGILAEPPETPN
ncbi:MAG TPA: CARDB domain-containing protein, partial [Mycobacterium sp.]|nr:CARDB domain-containing protein [Mycobacterium sp.]